MDESYPWLILTHLSFSWAIGWRLPWASCAWSFEPTNLAGAPGDFQLEKLREFLAEKTAANRHFEWVNQPRNLVKNHGFGMYPRDPNRLIQVSVCDLESHGPFSSMMTGKNKGWFSRAMLKYQGVGVSENTLYPIYIICFLFDIHWESEIHNQNISKWFWVSLKIRDLHPLLYLERQCL